MMGRARRVFALAAMLVALSGVHAEEADWEFSLSAYGYLVPDDADYVQPSFTADHGALHLEARRNYEDLDTGSVWLGYNLGVGDEVTLDVTPMLGAVFGNTDGIAAGYHATLGWRWLELYGEGEYVLAGGNDAESFFYAWSELTASPVEWFRAGFVGQRTRVYDSPREIQRGVLVGFTVRRVTITAHVFNPDDDDPLYVVSASWEF